MSSPCRQESSLAFRRDLEAPARQKMTLFWTALQTDKDPEGTTECLCRDAAHARRPEYRRRVDINNRFSETTSPEVLTSRTDDCESELFKDLALIYIAKNGELTFVNRGWLPEWSNGRALRSRRRKSAWVRTPHHPSWTRNTFARCACAYPHCGFHKRSGFAF